MNRHALVMICSTFHEIQHIATDMLLNPVTDLCEVDERTPPTPGPAKVAKVEKRSTPEHIGSTKYAGRVIGDSGFALEEKNIRRSFNAPGKEESSHILGDF